MTVFEQFGVSAYHTTRGRGALICETNRGVKLLRETLHGEEKYAKEEYVTNQLKSQGFVHVDTFVRTKEGAFLAEDEEGKRYYLKDWFMAGECDVKNYNDVSRACQAIAKMHKALLKVSVPCEGFKVAVSESLDEKFARKLKEMKFVRNYLRKKKNKSDFERRAYESMGTFYDEGERALLGLLESDYREAFEQNVKMQMLAHGACNHHNILNGKGYVAIVNFEKVSVNSQITDLYDFMRKILEKYNWDIKLAYHMIDEYDKVKAITEAEFDELAYLFAFPEKFFKVMNHYSNSSKFWMADKDVEKLNNVINQNEARLRFVESLK